MSFPIVDVESWFWARVEKGKGCWLWTGPRSPNGYGHCMTPTGAEPPRLKTNAHRIAFILTYGRYRRGCWSVTIATIVRVSVQATFSWEQTRTTPRTEIERAACGHTIATKLTASAAMLSLERILEANPVAVFAGHASVQQSFLGITETGHSNVVLNSRLRNCSTVEIHGA